MSKISNKKNILKSILVVLCLYLLFIVLKNLFSSSFFQHKDRLNIVVNQDTSTFYSMGFDDGVNYFISYFPDLEVDVPGGYGKYRLGALGKLATLEKKPELFRKTYSLVTSSTVDYYFYPSISSDKIGIYFGDKKKDFFLPQFYLIFFGNSNAPLFDRLYVYLLFLGKTKGQFKIISKLPIQNNSGGSLFLANNFFDTYQGIFYKATYRKEAKTVQILYSKSYNTAQSLGQILEGDGIRVVDLNESTNTLRKCQIAEDTSKFSKTAIAISQFLECNLVKKKTEAYDIIIELGKSEKEWEVN